MKSIYLKSVLAFIFVGVMAMIVCIPSFTLRNNLQHQNN